MAELRSFLYTPAIHKEQDGYLLSDNFTLLQETVIHHYLSVESYWAKDIPLATVQSMIAGSLCLGVYQDEKQVAFARMVTDGTTFGYLADVFVLEGHRKKGLSKWMIAALRSHPTLQGLRRWLLVTHDAHSLYEQFGFRPISDAHHFLTIHNPELYIND